MSSYASKFKELLDKQGYAVVEEVLSPHDVQNLLDSFQMAAKSDSSRHHGEAIFAMRNVLHELPFVKHVASTPPVSLLAQGILGENARPVKAILFDKTREANWKVSWHQDTTIAVKEKSDAEGFGPWSVKSGVNHVQPPQNVLENILTLRIHLDDCDAENGAIKVVPGSHKLGKLTQSQILQMSFMNDAVTCPVMAGGILMMRPLLLHSSSMAIRPSHRRVLHIEYTALELPNNIQWHAD